MKIKVNNIFKRIHYNKKSNVNYTNKRRNLNKVISENEIGENEKEVLDYKNIDNENRRRNTYTKNDSNIFKKIVNKFVLKKSYNILFLLMIVLASISIYTNFLTYKNENNESYAVFSSNEDIDENKQVESSISEDLQDITSNNIDTRENSENQVVVVSQKKDVSADSNAEKVVVEPLVFSTPIDGEIIKVYSVDKLLFSKTLESWKTHDGIDIKASLGQKVKSIEKGIIEKIYEDSFLGVTIIIDHGQGYKSIYANLDNDLNVKEKQVVKKGAVIGKVGKTSIGEIKDDDHIHFMLMLNNQVIDPSSKIRF